MKLNKKLFVPMLALALAVTAVIPTVSWYDHEGSLTGNQMGYARTGLPVSGGAVTAVTKKFRMDGNKLYYDEKGNKQYANDTEVVSDTISPISESNTKNAQYYGTTFTNTDTSPAYVNLYLQNFTNDPNNYIGTLQPSLTHKGISSTVHLANKSIIRAYFQWEKATNAWNASGAKTYAVCNTPGGVSVKEFDTTNHVLTDKAELKNKTTYYVDLAPNTTSFYFATDAGAPANINLTTGVVTKNWYRTNTITDVHAEMCYYLTGAADDTTWNAQYDSYAVPGGVSLMTYFDKVTMNKGQRAYITLNEGVNFTGASATYEVISGDVTVNANTGLITAGSSLTSAAPAGIKTTITGVLGDKMILGSAEEGTEALKTNVVNPATLSEATVALNVKVPGKTGDGNGTAEIVWYITNDSTADCSFTNIYYTK